MSLERLAARPGRGAVAGLGIAITLGALLRLALALLGPTWPSVSDGTSFERLAASLAAGQGFAEQPGVATSHRAPLQAVWLAALVRASPDGARRGAVGGALLGTLAIAAVWLLAWRLGGDAPAVWASLGAALYPRLVDYSVRLWSLSENLFVLVATLALALWLGAERGSKSQAMLAGIAFGLAALTRPVALSFPLLLLLRAGRGRGRVVALALAAWLLTLAPWTLRNYLLWGRVVPVSTMGGIVLYQGFHPPAEGWGFTPWAEIRDRLGPDPGDEPTRSEALVRATVADLRARPVPMLALLPAKLLGLFNPFSEHGDRLDVAFLVVLLLGVGAFPDLRRDPLAQVPIWWLLHILALTLVFYGSPRFRLPAEPVLIVFAASFAAGRARSERGRRELLALALAAVILWLLPGADRPTLRRRLGLAVTAPEAAAPGPQRSD